MRGGQGRAARPAQGRAPRRGRRAREVRRAARSRSPTGSRSSATVPTASPACPASAPRRPPRCSPATAISKRSPTTRAKWDVPGVRGAERLAATLTAGRKVAELFKDLATLRTDADVGTVDDWEWRGPAPETSPIGASVSDGRDSPGAPSDSPPREPEAVRGSCVDATRCSSSRCGRGSRKITLEPARALERDEPRARRAGCTRRSTSSRPTARCRVDRAHRRGPRVLRRARPQRGREPAGDRTAWAGRRPA